MKDFELFESAYGVNPNDKFGTFTVTSTAEGDRYFYDKVENAFQGFKLGLETKQEAVLVFAIEVEKLLCAKLNREWTAAGISIVSLIDELAAKK